MKVLDAFPQAKELLARDDIASNIAMSALPYGIKQYFNYAGIWRSCPFTRLAAARRLRSDGRSDPIGCKYSISSLGDGYLFEQMEEK